MHSCPMWFRADISVKAKVLGAQKDSPAGFALVEPQLYAKVQLVLGKTEDRTSSFCEQL